MPKTTIHKSYFRKIDIFLQHHFICNDCTEKEVFEVLFYNNDDNVCIYCGSKNTRKLFQARLKAKIENF
jgi:rRNA maturation endonuclease Nob1